jgi:hypothetical protein
VSRAPATRPQRAAASTRAPARADERLRAATVGAIALVAVGVVLRVVVLASAAGRLDSDEAVVALMATRLRAGHFELFYWGQHYGGVLEQLAVAIALSLHRSVLFVKLVPLALSALAAVLVARSGRRLFAGDHDRARLAGALCLAWPGTVWLATKERGFYWVTVVLVAAAFLLALRIRDDDGRDARRRDCLLLGVVAGLAWYETAQAAFVLVPLVLWLFVSVRLDRRALAWLGAGAVLGAAPWFVGLARDGGDVLAQPDYHVGYAARLRVVVGELLPRIAGVRGTFRGGWLLHGAGLVVWCVAIAALAWLVVSLVRGRAPSPLRAVVVIVLAFPFVAAVAHATWYAAEPRYALTLVPFLALLVASALTTARRVAVAVVLVTALGAANVASVLDAAAQPRAGVDLAPPSLTPLEHRLAADHTDRVYADYWIAYALTFQSGERVVAVPLDRPRDPTLQHAVDAAHARTWIVYADAPRDRALPHELASLGVGFERTRVGAFARYRLARFVDPRTLPSFWRHVHDGR